MIVPFDFASAEVIFGVTERHEYSALTAGVAVSANMFVCYVCFLLIRAIQCISPPSDEAARAGFVFVLFSRLDVLTCCVAFWTC